MDNDKKEWEKKAKSAYAPPLTELFASGPCSLLAGTYFGGGSAGGASFGEYMGGSAGSASFGTSGSGGSAGGGSFGSSFGGGGGSAGGASLSTGAREFTVTFTDPWG